MKLLALNVDFISLSLSVFLQFLAMVHISKVNCAEMAGDNLDNLRRSMKL